MTRIRTRWALGLVVLTTAAQAATVASATFEPPAGWARSEAGGVVTFSAPGLAAGERAMLEVFPGEETADFRGWFERAWAGVKAGYRDAEEAPVSATRSDRGHDTLLAAGSMADAGGQFVYLALFAAHQGGRVQPMLITAGSAAHYQRCAAMFDALAKTFAMLPRAKWPPPARAGFQSRARAAMPAAVAAAPAPPRPGPAGSVVGAWRTLNVSSISYVDLSTGAHSSPSGASVSYEFRGDGTFKYGGLAQLSVYQCSTSSFDYDLGRWSLAGDRLTLRPEVSTTTWENTCNRSKNREAKRPLAERSFTVRFEEDGRTYLHLIDAAGNDVRYAPDR